MPDLSGDQFGYRGAHRPAEPDHEEESTGAPLHALDRVAPDFYDTPPRYWNFGGDPKETESVKSLHQYRDQPDAPVTVYRSLPHEHAEQGINPGDWVTLEHDYAAHHGMHAEDPDKDWPVISRQVRASELYNSGDSFLEFGWHPPKEST
jgi:hypothetical protein